MEFQSELIVLFGRVQIRYYGIVIVVAMLIAAFVVARLVKRKGLDPDHIWGTLTWAIIPAIILARLWYVLFPPVSAVAACTAPGVGEGCLDTTYLLSNFFNLENGAIAIWSGGLSIFGAVLGGAIGSLIYLRLNKLNTWQWLDFAGVGLPLGQAIGRWANAINQELYGTVTTLPWGITIDRANRVAPYTSTVEYPAETLFHPLFLYESIWNFLAFVVLLRFSLRPPAWLRQGDILLLYIMQYAFIRFVLEFIRVEVTLVAGINWSQVVCVVAFAVALIVFVLRRNTAPAAALSAAPAVQSK